MNEDEMLNNAGASADMPTAPAGTEATAVEDRPNRKAFSDRFKKRHADIDFEDKEARYGAMNEDADMLSQYEDSGRALSDIFDANKWVAAMLMDLKDNPDMSPIEWMASQGIDIQEALNDPETAKKVAAQIAKHQESVSEQKKHEEELTKNLRKSRENLDKALGLEGDEASELWNKVWEMISDAENGIISRETWQMFQNGYNYSSDVETARNEGAMQGRNEKIQNKLRKSGDGTDVPPTLSASGNGNAPATNSRSKSSFWDDIRN